VIGQYLLAKSKKAPKGAGSASEDVPKGRVVNADPKNSNPARAGVAAIASMPKGPVRSAATKNTKAAKAAGLADISVPAMANPSVPDHQSKEAAQ